MKSINILFLIVAVALGYFVLNGSKKSVTEMVEDELSTGASAPVRSQRPL